MTIPKTTADLAVNIPCSSYFTTQKREGRYPKTAVTLPPRITINMEGEMDTEEEEETEEYKFQGEAAYVLMNPAIKSKNTLYRYYNRQWNEVAWIKIGDTKVQGSSVSEVDDYLETRYLTANPDLSTEAIIDTLPGINGPGKTLQKALQKNDAVLDQSTEWTLLPLDKAEIVVNFLQYAAEESPKSGQISQLAEQLKTI